ncbi:hypothetical protein NL676_028247 [Syzygium grande]|nr:hypothetical protein NL676_028247 [Syzygium grande]
MLAECLVINIEKVLHELDLLPSKIDSKVMVEESAKSGATDTRKIQLEITTAWRELVMEKKKMNGVC